MIYKPILAAKIKEERAFEKKQKQLRNQYGIQKQNVVVVEKSNTLKFLVNKIVSLLKLAACITLIALAFIGLVAVVYPEPRAELLLLYKNVMEQLLILLGR